MQVQRPAAALVRPLRQAYAGRILDDVVILHLRNRMALAALALAVGGGHSRSATAFRSHLGRPHVGERLNYSLSYGPIHVGRGEMRIEGLETLATRPVWHATLRVSGGIPFFHVNDTTSSWFDTVTFNSYRFFQGLHDGPYHADRYFEIDPARQVYTKRGEVETPSVGDPLDDVSFIYFVRSLELEPGAHYEFNRYFQPDGNPVTIRVLRREQVTVPAGTFNAVVIEPRIVTSALFGQGGRAQLWFSDDSVALLLKMEAH